MPMNRVAVIIVTYLNQEALADLTRLLPSLEAVNLERDRWEIVLVDNPAPGGRCADYLQKEWLPRAGKTLPHVTLLRSETNTGFAGGNVLGAKAAREHGCAYAYLLNQDTDVDPSFLREALAVMDADPSAGLVQSLLLLGKQPELVNSWGNAYHFLGYSYCGGYRRPRSEAPAGGKSVEIAAASGAAVLVRLAALGARDIFDEKFFLYHEDVDLSLRIRLAGYRLLLAPASVVRHHYVFARSMTKFRWMERNRFVVLLTAFKWPTLALLVLPLLGVEIFSLLFALRGGWFGEKMAAYRMLMSRDVRRWIADRRRAIQSVRRVSDRELLRLAESRILFQEGQTDGFVLRYIANPLMWLVWKALYALVRW